MSVRRLATLIVALLLVLAAAHAAYWFHVAGLLRKGLERWAEDRRAQGWVVEWRALEVAGFPGNIHARFGGPHVVSPAGLEWHTDSLSAKAHPFNLKRLAITAPGTHLLRGAGAEAALTANSLRLDLNLEEDGSLADATLLANTIHLVPLGQPSLDLAGLALTWDPLVVAQPNHQTATVRFSATAHGIALPEIPGLPLDRQVKLAEITGRVMGEVTAAPPVEALARWAAEGGIVELDHVSLDWEPLGLEGDGTIALDPDGQPLAALSAKVRGYGPFMDRLAGAGTVDAGAAGAAKLLLSLMAKPDAKGRPVLPVPLSIQGGAVYLGPTRVGSVPPIPWENR